MLSAASRNRAPPAVGPVEIAGRRDHKHRAMSRADARSGRHRVSVDRSKAICRKRAAGGTAFTAVTVRPLHATCGRTAHDCLEAHARDAPKTGLGLDRPAAEEANDHLAENIVKAATLFLENPHENPLIPDWNPVNAADAAILADRKAAAGAAETEYAVTGWRGGWRRQRPVRSGLWRREDRDRRAPRSAHIVRHRA